jgi:adenylate kinase family enzyme
VVKRVAVKGASGAGKSTLARRLAERLGVPHVELDALHHGPNWTPASASALRARVASILDDDVGWVVDGNYESKLENLILDRAELIVWLDLPLRTKLVRLARRTARRWVLNEELWNGNRESLKNLFLGDQALFPWAIQSHFRHRRDWTQLFAGRSVVRLHSDREVEKWLEGLGDRRR